jgi:vancomycin aglycone glucosyltransferase
VRAGQGLRGAVGRVGVPLVPLGRPMRSRVRPSSSTDFPARGRVHRRAVRHAAAAAEGCNALVATGFTHFVAWSLTDKLDIPYVWATFCPINLPSPHHPLPQGGGPAINTHRVAIEAMVNA